MNPSMTRTSAAMPVRAATTGAIVALLAAPVAIAIADLNNPQWNWLEHMASHFVHGRAGWLIPLALGGVAAASALLTLLARAAGSTGSRDGRVGTRLLAVWSAAVALAAVFPADPPGHWDRPPSPAGLVHGLSGMAAFLVLPLAVAILTRAWRRSPHWRPVRAALTLTATLVAVTFVLFMVTWIDVLGGPDLSVGSHPTLAGITERLMFWADLAWLCVVAVGLRRQPAAGAANTKWIIAQ
jgi:hypothetical membrane protein